MTGWENPLAIVFDAVGTALGRLAGFFFACWVGCGIALASVNTSQGALPLGCTPLMAPVYWLGGIAVGLYQGWGLIAYLLIFWLLIVLVQSDRAGWWIFASAVLIQAVETARMLVMWGVPMRWWLYVPLLMLVIGASGGAWWLAKKAEAQRTARRERRRSGYCVECGYDLRVSIRAGGTQCPECGTEIPLFTIKSVRAGAGDDVTTYESPAA